MSETQVVILSHAEFSRHSTFKPQVQKLVDEAFQRDKLPGENPRSYRRAFMHSSRGRHHLLIVQDGNVVAHYTNIPVANHAGKQEAHVGHIIVKPRTAVGVLALRALREHLRSLGFSCIRGTYYSKDGSILGKALGHRIFGQTARGRKYKIPGLTHFATNISK